MFRTIRITPLSLAAGVSLLAFASGTAEAQMLAASTAATTASEAAATAANADSPPTQGLGDIVVTAERRNVSLQTAPLTVSVIDADSLKAANITDITGLNGSVPGLVVARGGGGERAITIRGIGSETPENTDTQPGVSYHVDGVYIFNSIATDAAFIDVAQVEVLRGPQGTMFGQGSTGGTINVVTNQPKVQDFSGNANLGGGNHGYFEGSGAINIPIGDTIAIRGAVQHTQHEGYSHVTDVAGHPNFREDDADDTGWRLAAIWQPADNFSITLNTIQYRSDTHGPAQKNILDPNSDPRVLTQDYPGRVFIKTQLYSGTIKWDTPFATIRSITSYQKLHSEQSWDADGLTPDLFYALTYSPLTYSGYNYDHVALWQSDVKSYTQEVNISSDKSKRLQWIVGGVYLHSKNTQYINEYRAADDDPLRPALPVGTAWDDPAVAALTYADLASITREEEAAYFQATYNVTDKLSLIGGARYNHDKYTGTDNNFSGGVPTVTSGNYLQPAGVPGYQTTEWTGKASIQYKITHSNMVYASYTRGFKPGGINAVAASGGSMSIKPDFLPETVDSFEIGSKNRFLNDTIQLDASAFLYNYRNMQFLEDDPILYGNGISNAPKARIYGLEAEGKWLITKHWKLDGSASFIHGTFTQHYDALDPGDAAAAQTAAGYPGYLYWSNFAAAVAARDAARKDIKGNDVPKMPHVQGTVALTYTNHIGPGEATARVQYIYRGKYNYRLFNNSVYDTVPSYNQVNLMLDYVPDHSKLDLSLRITNLFNKAGVNSRFTDPYGSAQTFETYIPPRQIVGSVGFKF